MLNRENLIILAIIIVGSIFRFWNLGWNGFNADEAIYSGQAASLLGEEAFIEHFSVFRSHPLLFQFFIALTFAISGIQDVTARIVAALFGILTVILTYFIGKELFNKKVGIVAALIIALNGYHIVFSRQVLLDVPLAFFFTLTLYLIVRYRISQTSLLAYLIGVASGLTFLSKEVGIFAIVVFLLYVTLTRKINVRRMTLALLGYGMAISPFILALLFTPGALDNLLSFSSYQFERSTNTNIEFYAIVLLQEALGYGFVIMCIVAGIVGMIVKKYRLKDQTILLLISICVPLIFFQLIPIKGVRFLLPIIPACALLVSALIMYRPIEYGAKYRFIVPVLISLILLSNNFFLSMIIPTTSIQSFKNLGTPLERETALWIRDNTSEDDTILTGGTRMSDIVKFYSNRDVFAIRDNPNPAYQDTDNAGLMIVNNKINYLIYSSYDVDTTNKLDEKIGNYVKNFNATLVYTGYSKDGYEFDTLSRNRIMSIYKIN